MLETPKKDLKQPSLNVFNNQLTNFLKNKTIEIPEKMEVITKESNGNYRSKKYINRN